MLSLFKLRTFRAAVVGSLVGRLGLSGIPFLFPLLYQIGLGFTPVQSGMLIAPQAMAAIGLKIVVPKILARFGYRTVLIANTFVVGAMIMLFATVGADTPAWRIVLQAFVLGFFTSMQYTSMNTLVYADVTGSQTSSASTIASTGQQMSISFGVASASLIASLFVPEHLHSDPAAMIHGVHEAFIALGVITIASSIVFMELRKTDGGAVSSYGNRKPKAPV